MKKTFKIILAAVAMAAIAVSCAKEPNGYEPDDSGAVVLEAFGPNPVLRGSSLSFIGKHLDIVKSVEFGGGVVVTSLTDKTEGGFKVIVPMEAETGKLTLTYDGGTIVTSSDLTFTEQYSISEAKAESSPLKPGDLVTVTGEYLNNVTSLGFAGNQKALTDAEQFTEQDRHKIVAPVPRGAASGKLFLMDANGNQLFSEEEFTVAQPAISGISPLSVRPGDELTITGTLLESVDEIAFHGASAIEIADAVSVTDTKLVVKVPGTVQDGTISITSAAGVQAVSADAITVKVPTGLAVAAESVFKAGLNVVITGTDIDLVTGVAFGNETVETFTNDGSKVTAAIPVKAVDGAITISTASGKSVQTESITLVKPVITAVSPAAITAGDDVTVTGTDLDLVVSLTIGGADMEFETVSATELKVSTSATVPSGKVGVKAANGVSAESEAEITVSYDALVNVTSLTSPASVGDEVVMEGSNFNLIDAIYFGDVKVTAYSERTDTRFAFLIPEGVDTGSWNPRFVLFNGDEEVCAYAIDVKGKITTLLIWEGEQNVGTAWDGSAVLNLAWQHLFDAIPYGCVLHVEYVTNSDADYQQIAPLDGDWALLSCCEPFNNGYGCIDVGAGTTHFQVDLNNADVDLLVAKGLVCKGFNVTYTKVYLTYENKDTEPILPTDIMLNDYEAHGGHDGSWDGSWSGCASAVEEGGNHVLEITSEATGAWIINCNHFDDVKPALPEGESIENYVVKIDIFIPSGWAQDGTCKAQLVLGDQWCWWGETFLAGITGNGKWATYTFSHTFTGAHNLMGGTNGLYIDGTSSQALPVGMKFDNFRLSHK